MESPPDPGEKGEGIQDVFEFVAKNGAAGQD